MKYNVYKENLPWIPGLYVAECVYCVPAVDGPAWPATCPACAACDVGVFGGGPPAGPGTRTAAVPPAAPICWCCLTGTETVPCQTPTEGMCYIGTFDFFSRFHAVAYMYLGHNKLITSLMESPYPPNVSKRKQKCIHFIIEKIIRFVCLLQPPRHLENCSSRI